MLKSKVDWVFGMFRPVNGVAVDEQVRDVARVG